MVVATELFTSPDLYFAELSCPPDDPEWGEDNLVTRHILALPAAPVWQRHGGGERQLLNQNHVIHHTPGSEYRRERFRGAGYRCLFFFPSADLAREVAAEFDPSAGDGSFVGSAVRTGPLDAATFALSRLVAWSLRSSRSDPLGVREALYAVLRGAIRAPRGRTPSPRITSSSTQQARRELVAATKEVLTTRMAERIRLDDLAAALYTSPYHLARVFRDATGFSIHGYQVNLRLRTGLDRLPGRNHGIGAVGFQLGYASHSHFTASFRRTFGLSPSSFATLSSARP
jgi:AraC family transcriptional regulator